jgi:uncharacterized protein YkwD
LGEAKSSDILFVFRTATAGVLLAATICAGAAAGSRHDTVVRAASAQQVSAVPQLQTELLDAINELRASKGLSRLRLNRGLALASLSHSISMARHGFFAHEGYDGSAFWHRIKARYRPGGGSWEVGENIVWASERLSARETLNLWLQSPPHRKTLLTAAWRDVGVGAVRAEEAPGVYQGLDVTIVTADFGVR